MVACDKLGSKCEDAASRSVRRRPVKPQAEIRRRHGTNGWRLFMLEYWP
jgi:hypothetical protein